MQALGDKKSVLVVVLTTAGRTIFLSLFCLVQGSLVIFHFGIDTPWAIMLIVLFVLTLPVVAITMHKNFSTHGEWRPELDTWLREHKLGHRPSTAPTAAAAPTAPTAAAGGEPKYAPLATQLAGDQLPYTPWNTAVCHV